MCVKVNVKRIIGCNSAIFVSVKDAFDRRACGFIQVWSGELPGVKAEAAPGFT